MEFLLKLKAEFNCFVEINELNFHIEENEYKTCAVSLNNGEFFNVNISPKNLYKNLLLPYKINIRNNNGKIIVENSFSEFVVHENVVLLILKKAEVNNNLNILLANNDINIFNTNTTSIITNHKSIALNDKFEKISQQKYKTYTLYFLENEFKKYVVVLNGQSLIYSNYYNEIQLNKKIEILSKINDISKHAIVTTIENNLATQKIVYENNQPMLVKNPSLIPLAFLQALKIENIKLCYHYLNDNLKNTATIENLKNYFGGFNKVEPLSLENNKIFALFYDTSIKLYSFTIENNKIVKINTI